MFAAIRHRGGWIAAALALSSAGAFLALAPRLDLTDSVLLAALAAIAGVAYSLKVWLQPDSEGSGGITFDAAVVVALVALYLAGPWAALVVWLVPDALHRLVHRRAPLVTRGLALNFASFALAALAGHVVVEAVSGFAGLVLAGLAMVEVNFVIAGWLYSVLFEGKEERRLLVAEHGALTPVTIAMIALGAGTALLADHHGFAGFALLSVAVALPEIQWPSIAARLPVPPPQQDRAARVERDAAATHTLVAAVVSQLDAVAALATRDRAPERLAGPARPLRQRGEHA